MARQGIWISLPILKPLGFTGWARDGTQWSERPLQGINKVQGSGHSILIGLHSDQVGVTSVFSCPVAPYEQMWESLNLVALKELFRKLPNDSKRFNSLIAAHIAPCKTECKTKVFQGTWMQKQNLVDNFT